MLGAALIPGLFVPLMHITDPAMTPQVFNHWYEDIHIPEALNANVSNLVLRYANHTPGRPDLDQNSTNLYSTQYLALWKLPNIYNWNDTALRKKMPVVSPLFPDGGKQNKTVTTWVDLKTSVWRPVQTFEGKSSRNDTPEYMIMAKIEPGVGGDQDLETWYRVQHLDMLSMLPSYRRSTRYMSDDGSAPRSLAIHEVDALDLDPHSNEVLLGTELASRVLGNAKIADFSTWRLIKRAGTPGEKL